MQRSRYYHQLPPGQGGGLEWPTGRKKKTRQGTKVQRASRGYLQAGASLVCRSLVLLLASLLLSRSSTEMVVQATVQEYLTTFGSTTLDRCNTKVLSIQGIGPTITIGGGQINNAPYVASGYTDDQSFMDGSSYVMNSVQKEHDCFPQKVPWYSYQDAKSPSSTIKYTKFVTHQLLKQGEAGYISFESAPFVTLPCLLCKANPYYAMMIVLLKKKSSAPTSQGHVMLMVETTSGDVISAYDFSYPLNDANFKAGRRYPLAFGMTYLGYSTTTVNSKNPEKNQIWFSDEKWKVKMLSPSTNVITSTELKSQADGLSDAYNLASAESFIERAVVHNFKVLFGGSIINTANDNQWPLLAVFEDNFMESVTYVFNPTTLRIQDPTLNGRMYDLYGNSGYYDVYGLIGYVKSTGEISGGNMILFWYDKNNDRKLQIFSILLEDAEVTKKIHLFPMMINKVYHYINVLFIYTEEETPTYQGIQDTISINPTATAKRYIAQLGIPFSASSQTNSEPNVSGWTHDDTTRRTLIDSWTKEENLNMPDTPISTWSTQKDGLNILFVNNYERYGQVRMMVSDSSDLNNEKYLQFKLMDHIQSTTPTASDLISQASAFQANTESAAKTDCSAIQYSHQPIKAQQLTAGEWGTEFKAGDLTANSTVDLKPHVSFTCDSTESQKCIDCPLAIQWFWTNGDKTGTPGSYDTSTTVLRPVAVHQYVNEDGKFYPKQVNVHDQLAYKQGFSVMPYATWKTMFFVTPKVTGQYAQYQIIYNVGPIMRWPMCKGLCTKTCTVSGQDCSGKFIVNNIYTFQGVTSVDQNLCYVYKNTGTQCFCSPTYSQIISASNFEQLPSCPTLTAKPNGDDYSMSLVTTTTPSWMLIRGKNPLEKDLKSILTFGNSEQRITKQTVKDAESGNLFSDLSFTYTTTYDQAGISSYKIITPTINNPQKQAFSNLLLNVYLQSCTSARIDDTFKQVSGITTYPLRYFEPFYPIRLSYKACQGEATAGIKTLSVDFDTGLKTILTELEIKALFTIDQDCDIANYDIVETEQSSGSSTFKTFWDVSNRIKADYKEIKSDTSNFGPQPIAPAISSNFQFLIKAHDSKDQSYPIPRYKQVSVTVNFYDCTTKKVNNLVSLTQVLEYDVVSSPTASTIDFNTNKVFSVDSKCPITTYSIRMEDKITGATPSGSTAENFYFDAVKTSFLKLLPKNGGKYTFWVFASTAFSQSASQKYEVSMLPCGSGFGSVSLPSSFNALSIYYVSYDASASLVTFKVTNALVPEAEMTSLSSKIKIPLFVSSDPTLCPLSYVVSGSKTGSTEVSGLTGPTVVDDGLEFSFKLLSTKSQTFDFYISAYNPSSLKVQSPLIQVAVEAVCSSYTEKIQKDATVEKKVSFVLYVDDITGTIPEFKTVSPFKDVIAGLKLDSISVTDCTLKSPFIVVTSTSKKEEAPIYTYQIDSNTILTVNSDSLADSTASLKTDAGGFKTTFNAEIPDVYDNKIVLEVTFVVCGTKFWETDVCLRDKPAEVEVVSEPPTIETDYVVGLNLEDQWEIYEEGILERDDEQDTDSLKYTVKFGEVKNTEKETLSISAEVDSALSSFIKADVDDLVINLDVDMLAFYQSVLAVPGGDQVEGQVTIKVKGDSNELEKSYDIKFPQVPEQKEEEPEPETQPEPVVEEEVTQPEPEPVKEEKPAVKEEKPAMKEEKAKDKKEAEFQTAPAFVPKFNFKSVPKRKSKNEPVKKAPANVPAAKRTAPQISSIDVSFNLATITFSKAMMYPTNWISKYLSDAKLDSVDIALVDSISVPFIQLWYEQAGTEGKQVKLPDSDIKILKMSSTQIMVQVGFDSLDDPEAISLTDVTVQDLLVVDVPKALILNGQQGESLILDEKDFDDEDSGSFYATSGLEPQKITPKSSSTESVQGAVDSSPAMNAAGTLLGLAGSLLVNSPPEDVSDDQASEQQSTTGSATKAIQPGHVNGFNQNMQKSAGMDYKAFDFLQKRNMTWTSQPPEGDGLKRMGIKSRNMPKTVGSTLIGGAGGMLAASVTMPLLEMATGAFFEGGSKEISVAQQVVIIKKKFKLSQKVPLTPTINAFIGMIFLKILLGGIVNNQNNHLLVWDNFGPNGILSTGDQISILVGNIGLWIALLIMLMICVNMVTEVKWCFGFGKKVVGIENILRRKQNHKWFLFSSGQIRTFITIYVIIYQSTPNFQVPQILISIFFNPTNLLFAWNLKPLPKVLFLDLNIVAKIADVAAILVMYHQLMITDITSPKPQGKIFVGWIVLVLGQVKFYMGKTKLIASQYNLHKKKFQRLQNCCAKLTGFFKIQNEQIAHSDRFFNISRQQLVDNYRIRHKEKFYKLDPMPLDATTHYRIAPIEAFKFIKPKKDPEGNMFSKWEVKKRVIPLDFNPGKMQKKKFIRQKLDLLQLSPIVEHENAFQEQSGSSIVEFSNRNSIRMSRALSPKEFSPIGNRKVIRSMKLVEDIDDFPTLAVEEEDRIDLRQFSNRNSIRISGALSPKEFSSIGNREVIRSMKPVEDIDDFPTLAVEDDDDKMDLRYFTPRKSKD